MLAVMHPAKDVLKTLRSRGYDQKLDVAASNSPNQVVLSGDSSSIKALMREFEDENIQCRQLEVRNAFHSRQQDCIQRSFTENVAPSLQGGSGQRGKVSGRTIPMLSTVTGRYLTQKEANKPQYWWSNIRQKVSFQAAIETLSRDGFQVFVEIGPHPVLLQAVKDTIRNMSRLSDDPITTGSLVRPRNMDKPPNDSISLMLNHAKLFVSGVPVNFDSYFEDNCMAVVSVPKYPWQREQCSAIEQNTVDEYRNPVKHHPLLGKQQRFCTNVTSPSKWWKVELTKSTVPWLKDHVIGGSIILPAAAYIEISLAVCRELFHGFLPISLRNIDFQKFMYVSNGKGNLETTSDAISPTQVHIAIRSCDQDNQSIKWNQHMEADIVCQQEDGIWNRHMEGSVQQPSGAKRTSRCRTDQI